MGARLIAVSPQTAKRAANITEQYGLTFDLLSDPHNSLAQQYGIVFHL
ncbi:TPA: hypothetical protein DCE37_14580 [Candidatus Latescibacteria bacterium]|nr:hypothetical protein [Gemmatimonadota bacterium]HAA76339.1 hypothetical protein [Candidatus Latescibacterota bacterium]